MIYLDRNDPRVVALRRFSSYAGTKFAMEYTTSVQFEGTQWSGGSRNTYTVIRLRDMQIVSIPEAPFLERSELHEKEFNLSVGYVVIQHTMSCGHDLGLTFYVNPDTVEWKELPPASNATREERIVLAATAGLKSSYGGIKDLRFHESHERTGISQAEYSAAKESCIRKGWLNKAGAITVTGRNVIGNDRLEQFRKESRGPFGPVTFGTG